jgi:hypothetical protein
MESSVCLRRNYAVQSGLAAPAIVGGSLILEEKVALVLSFRITQGRGYTFHSSQMYVNLCRNF